MNTPRPARFLIEVRRRSRVRGSYPVHVACGLLERLPDLIGPVCRGRRVWVVTDSNVLRLYGRRVLRSLVLAGMDAVLCEVPPGEASKNERTLHGLQTALLRQGIDRRAILLALGGGVVGDLTGFTAATILRGVEYIQVPTTLLAQVDSSVGGKVGVNHRLGKNLIGAFHPPSAVYTDPSVLSTLPTREFRSGLAEMIKIAAAIDRRFFLDLERNIGRMHRRAGGILAPLIARAVGLKASVVEQDERESGLRQVLNLGHTIGHAFEHASGYALRHGEAVAMGMAAEADVALAMGLLPPAERARLRLLLRRAGLPLRPPRGLNRRRFLGALSADKKSVSGVPAFVLLRRPGCSIVGVHVPSPFVRELPG